MARQRTPQEHEDMSPVSVKLGDATYQIPVLRRGKAAIWRKQLAADIVAVFDARLPDSLADVPTSKALGGLLTKVVCDFPDAIFKALLAYFPELPASQISEAATDGQIVAAFSAVWDATFPFEPLPTVLREKFASVPVQ